jgi:hypothetical protein
MRRLMFAIMCVLAALPLAAEAQILSLPFPGQQNRTPNKKPRTAEDVLNAPQDTSAADAENPSGSDFVRYSSRGWFPAPFPVQSLYLFSPIDFPTNLAASVRFPGLPTTTFPFTLKSPYDDDAKRYPFKAGSRTDREGAYPDWYNTSVNLLYEITLPVPLILRFGAEYAWTGTTFFSDNQSARYLPSSTAERETVQIVNALLVEEKRLQGTVGVKIPVYGVFADFVDQRVSSYYYCALAAAGSYTFWQNTLQYAQILSTSDNLRFANGTDTTRRWNAPMPNFNQTRLNIDIAVGWALSGEISFGSLNAGLAAMMELYCTLPTGTVLSGVEWRQYVWGVRFMIGSHRRL